MIRTIQNVFESALERLSSQIITYVPPLLVGLTILLASIILAHLVRLLVSKVVKGAGADRLLRRSGLSSVIPGSDQIRVVPILSNTIHGMILLIGTLTAVNVFDTKLTSQIVEGTIFLLPKLVSAAAILLGGFWLAQFLGRSILIWASNEELPFPRRIAAALRVAVAFSAVVVAADILDFAERVFFAAFVILAGGAVLTCSLAVGLGAKEAVHTWLLRRENPAEADQSLFKHV